MIQLGVNVDHVATIRNARGVFEPDPVQAAMLAESSGADSIVCHLREDRRHIRDDDVRRLANSVKTSLQLEMALHPGVIAVALEVKPPEVMIVPERREELTTEGGFDCVNEFARLADTVAEFRAAGIKVSVFIDAHAGQVEAARKAGATIVELHTGPYSHAATSAEARKELDVLAAAAKHARALGLEVHAGHGLNYENLPQLLREVPLAKVNIGHSIVSRAVFTGLDRAVAEIKALMRGS